MMTSREAAMSETKDFDQLITQYHNQIQEALKMDLQSANVLSYNLSADLVDCWPGDDDPREPRHYKAGLEAAQNCLAWRKELQKGPGPFSKAYWLKGAHELSLWRTQDAVDSFKASLEYAREQAGDSGEELSSDSPWSVLLGEGFLRLAELANGRQEALAEFDRCCTLFEESIVKSELEKSDLEYCLGQLKKAFSIHISAVE